MALADDVAALPTTPVPGQVGHDNNHGTAHQALQAHQLAIPGQLVSLTPATTSIAPTVGKLNLYDATAGPLIPLFPLANSVRVGTVIGVKKVDASANTVTPTCSGADHINSATGATAGAPILTQNQIAWYASDGSGVWTLVYGHNSLASLDVRYPPTTGPIHSDLSAFGVYLPEAHGAKGDGTTDDTAAVNATIAAAQTNGGKVWLQNKTYLCLGAITPVYSGPSTAPVQKPLRITSNSSATNNGYWAAAPVNGGPVLDLRYTGADGLHPAKIDTRGAGTLELDHITLVSGGTDNFPFFQTTNTTCFARHCAFVGNTANSGLACVQDAIVFGGTTNVLGDGAQAPFQGYGSKVNGNYFSHIRRCFLGQSYCNGITVEDNTVSTSCGSSTGGAIEFRGNATAGFCTGNFTRGNTIETSYYLYGIAAYWAATNVFGPDGYYDEGPSHAAAVFLDTTCQYNEVYDGMHGDNFPFVLDPAGRTTVHTAHQSQNSILQQPQIFKNIALSVGYSGPTVMEYVGNQAQLNITRGIFPYSEAQVWTAPQVYAADGVTTTGSAVIKSATAAWTAQDVGMPIQGSGIAYGSFILSFQSATQVTLNAPITGAGGTGVVLNFGRLASTFTPEVGFSRRHIVSKGDAPTVSVYGQSGTGATVTVTGTDTAFTLTLKTGTGTTAGGQCAIAAAINWAATPRVVITARNAAAAAAMTNVWMDTATTAVYVNAVAPLAVSTVYVWDVIAIS